MNGLLGKIRRVIGYRRRYQRWRDWLVCLHDRALHHPVGRFLPGHGKIFRIFLRGNPRPFFLRSGGTDWRVFEDIYFAREYDDVFRTSLSDVRQIVDLGANIGLTVRLWEERFPQASVIAVEPDPQNVQLLRLNTGGHEKIRIVQACAAGSSKTVSLDRSLGAWGVRMVDADAHGGAITASALTLQQILEDAGFEGKIDLLKCDIEGAEMELFQNCAGWIGRVRLLVLELHPPYTVEKWQSDLNAAGVQLKVFITHKTGTGDQDMSVILAGEASLLDFADARGPGRGTEASLAE